MRDKEVEMTRVGSMMMMALLHAGCVQAAYDEARALSVTDASSSTTEQEGTAAPVPDGTAGGPVETVTGAGPTTESAPSSSTMTGELAMVPAVLEIVFSPEPITAAGTIAVEVTAEHATGVAMQLNDAMPIDLSPAPLGKFVGEIAVETGLANGMHAATFVPRSDDSVGEPVIGHYTIALPSPGSEALWDAPPDFGKGQIAAIEVLDEAEVIAFGTAQVNGAPRCFLHRRDLQGQYSDDDFALVDADTNCAAIDLVIGEDASIWMLMAVIENGETRWRLMRTTWGAAPVVARTGLAGEVAHALAYGGGEKVVACGAGPAPGMSRDAWIWGLGESKAFDYAPNGKANEFAETVRDCKYTDRLVMVGEAYGFHDEELLQPPARDRMFVLETGLDAKDVAWHVAEIGPGTNTQSRATTLVIDAVGRYVIGVSTCTDLCEPAGELRIYEPGGKLVELTPLQADVMPPRELAWSPAGYMVMASARRVGDDSTEFLVQAFNPGEFEPAWVYGKAAAPALYQASALAILSGAVIAGGRDGDGYPAIAYLYP
ncbi:hypothetical protein [Nannocystis radixulma]|uniref:Uncharacterized protein n=1 Tax=Nannocystis radixulma TaxID=2995305 RepID=A0ABT5BJ40_9BACT|nr:hypothetical protein [Nannocystis radixulma]MDC0673544.1 hypothetical protein [Nannocystis radixulma]